MTTIIAAIQLLLSTHKPVLGQFHRMMFTMAVWPVRIVCWFSGALLGAIVGGIVQGWKDGMHAS